MATYVKAFQANSSSTVSSAKRIKAKCPENQKHVDLIAEKRAKCGKNNYSTTLQRAMENVAKCKEPITTYNQAISIKYVGDHIANMICPEKENTLRTAKRKETSSSQCSVAGSAASSVASKRRKPTNIFNQELKPIIEKPSLKDSAYEKAVANALSYKGVRLNWRVVLLVDIRETKSEHIVAKCRMSGIPCEERSLPIGDMAWILEGRDRQDAVQAQLMAGTIIERKTTADLKSSLFGTRYNEQQLRLKNSGLPQVLFLIEGDLNADLIHCSAETLHTAVWAIRLHKQFKIIQTVHMDETVMTLKRIHRRILQRTFPEAFYEEALPTFHEPDAAGIDRRRESRGQLSRRHRRRRFQSLMEMTFDSEPVPIEGMERFITYQELKAKVERDREMGTRTVGSIHAAMLKQVASLSDKKCQAVARAFPTANSLMMAYDQSDVDKQQSLLAELPIQDPGKSTAQMRRLGLRSSSELYIAYGIDGPHRDDDPSKARLAQESASTYMALVSETQKRQESDPSVLQKLASLHGSHSNKDTAASPDDSNDGDFWDDLHERTKTKIAPSQPDDPLLNLTFSDEEENELINNPPPRMNALKKPPAYSLDVSTDCSDDEVFDHTTKPPSKCRQEVNISSPVNLKIASSEVIEIE